MGAGYDPCMPTFICPNCKDRSVDVDGFEGMSTDAVACHRCGFGFLFELLDDYYPGPNTGFVTCDKEGRILASGRGVFELTGFAERDLIGRDVVEALGLAGFDADKNPVALSLEWGVRRLGEEVELTTRAGQVKPITADVFPAYDEDGGLLVGLSPR
jgi:PAS domain S-box-containing protein